MDIETILKTQPVGQITKQHIDTMQTMLNNQQRAEVYLYYSKLVGNSDAVSQLMMQAQITTYSGVIGGAALMGNFQAKSHNIDLYDVTLDGFSTQIIQGMINAIKKNITPDLSNGDFGSGLLTADNIQTIDQGVWTSKNLQDWFPGNIYLSLDPSHPPSGVDSNGFIDFAHAIDAVTGGPLGKRIGEFSDYQYDSISDHGYTFKVNKDTGMVEGVFPESGKYSLLNDWFNGVPNFENSMIRAELWKYMEANNKSGDSIYDLYDKLASGEISKIVLHAQLLNFFNRAEASYKTYEPKLLALKLGEYLSVNNEVTGHHLYTKTSDGSVIEVQYAKYNNDQDNPSPYMEYDPKTDETVTYHLSPADDLKKLATYNHMTVDQLVKIAGNAHLADRIIEGPGGIDMFLAKKHDVVYMNPVDHDGDVVYQVLKGGSFYYDPLADNPDMSGSIDNSRLTLTIHDLENSLLGSSSGHDESDSSFLDGVVAGNSGYSVTMPSNVLNGDGIKNVAASNIVSDGIRPGAHELSGFGKVITSLVTTLEKAVDGVLGKVAKVVSTIFSGAKDQENVDPLVLDLNGDGVHLTNFQEEPVFFDADNDGFKEQTGWVLPTDGIVVMDKNGDGKINNISETLSEYFAPGVKNGFEANDNIRNRNYLRAA